MRKVLILGIGPAQVDALEYCKARGFEVHACSNSQDGPGRYLADVFATIDIVDVNSIFTYASSNKIDLVYCVGSDLGMVTAAKVSELIGLPSFVPGDVAELCHDKYRLRSTLGETFPGNIPFMLIQDKSDINRWKKFPCVLKPVDNQGQRGVFTISSIQDFHHYYANAAEHARSGRLIIEEYVNGPEYSVNVYLIDRRIELWQVSERITFAEYPGGLVKAHRLPPQLMNQDQHDKLWNLVSSTVEKLGIRNGPVYFQVKISRDGPKLIEVTPRLDGCHLWRLIFEYTGINLLDTTFRHLLGESSRISKNGLQHTGCELHFICEAPGHIVNREKHQIGQPSYLRWYYSDGQRVRAVNGYMEKIGYFICKI